MTFDLFKRLNLTAGQQVESQDLLDGYNFIESKIMDQLLSAMAHTGANDTSDANAPDFALEMRSLYAYALTIPGGRPIAPNATGSTITITPGVLYQKISTATGSTPSVLAYKFSGTESVSFANGDAVHPRVDIIQMQLSVVTDDIQSRPHLVPGTQASISCGSITTHVNSVIQARLSGSQGNNITISFVADGSGVGSLTVSGNAVVFHFQSGVTTVANFETAINATTPTQALVNVKTIGTPTSIFNSVTDTAGPTLLSGGVDAVVVSSVGLSTKTRVNCALSVKQGVPATSPQYPLPDAGNVIIAGMLIGTNCTFASGVFSFDQAGANAVLHDQRIPVGVKFSHIFPDNFHYDTSKWALSGSRDVLIASSGADSGAGANAVYRDQGGRLLAIAACSSNVTTGPVVGALAYKLVQYEINFIDSTNYGITPGIGTAFIGTLVTLGDVSGLSNPTTPGFTHRYRHFTAIAHLPSVGPVVTTNSSGITAPIWVGCGAAFRCPFGDFVSQGTQASGAFDSVALSAQPGNAGGFHGQNIVVGPVTFWVATGLS